MTLKRILSTIVLFTCVFWGPWYLTLILAIMFLIVFKNYWEVVIAGIVLDVISYVPSEHVWKNFGIFSISFVITLLAAEKLRKQLRT